MVHMPCYGIEGTSCLKRRGRLRSPSRSEVDLFITGYITRYEAGEIRDALYANAASVINNVFRVSLKQNFKDIKPAENIKREMLDYFAVI